MERLKKNLPDAGSWEGEDEANTDLYRMEVERLVETPPLLQDARFNLVLDKEICRSRD